MTQNAPESQSLQDVMNIMAAQGVSVQAAALQPKSAKPCSELDAFIEIDPLLAGLNKDYRQAKAERIDIIQMFGAESPMADVALDKEDSAWCAVQTRYLELRGDSDAMRGAQAIILIRQQEAWDEEQKEKQAKKEKESATILMLYRLEKYKKQRKKKDYLALIYLVLVVAAGYYQRPHAALSFNHAMRLR